MVEQRDVPADAAGDVAHEVVRIPIARGACSLCESYADTQAQKSVAVVSCEGACLRGEISRQAANIVCHELLADRTVRICLGGAFTKDTGQRALVRNAARVVVLEGCPVDCASRMLRGILPQRPVEVIHTDRLARFDKGLFGVDELGREEVSACAREAAQRIVQQIGAPSEPANV
jgi:uncharacterized metal-binding protein